VAVGSGNTNIFLLEWTKNNRKIDLPFVTEIEDKTLPFKYFDKMNHAEFAEPAEVIID